MDHKKYTVSHYILDRLKELGLKDIFGVPGDFVLGFFHAMENSGIQCIGTCNELNAAYAADGYARIRGIGAVATTYVVGELSAINGIAGAYAEKVPVVKIVGCPATHHFKEESILHHTIGNYHTPFKMYEMITTASTLLMDISTATAEIDRVLIECYYNKLPVYIGIPADIAVEECSPPNNKLELLHRPLTNNLVLQEALEEASKMLNDAKMPILIIDGEIGRYKMEKEVLEFIESSKIPFASLLLGKSSIDEHHPQFIGLYEGSRSREYVKNRVENADCILLIGAILSDFNTGGFTAKFEKSKSIFINIERLTIKHHHYSNVNFIEFLSHLSQKMVSRNLLDLDFKPASLSCAHRSTLSYEVQPQAKLTLQRFYNRVSHFLNKDSIMVVETGSSLFAGAETLQPSGSMFLSQAFFGSIGYSVGATLGVSIAAPKKRVCLFVGDGSFQVTCQDVSTMVRYNTNPIIFLINNDGYLIERVISDGVFNDIQPWQYSRLPEVFNGGWGCKVRTEDELEKALEEASTRNKEVVFIEVVLDKWDSPSSMVEAGKSMAKNNYLT